MKILKKLILKPGKLSEVNIPSLSVIALLIFIPLYPKFPLLSVPQTYVAIRAEDFLVAAVLILWLLTQFRKGFPFWQEKISRLIVLYWFIGALSLISALILTKSIVPHLGILHFLRRIEYMACFFVALSSIRKIRNSYTHLLTLLLSTVGVLIYGFGQKFFGWPVVSTMIREFSQGILGQLNEWTRVNSTFAGHYDLAAYLVIVLAITAAFLVWEKKFWLRALLAFFGIVTLYLLILTASRVSFVAYLIAISSTFLFLKKPLWLFFVLIFSLLFVLFSGELTERYLVMIPNLRSSLLKEEVVKNEEEKKPSSLEPPEVSLSPEPVEQKPSPALEKKEVVQPIKPVAIPTFGPPEPVKLAAQRSVDIRFKIEWPRAIKAFFKNPFLGTGFSSIDLATDNDYLRMLGETGIFGFLSFNLIFLELFKKSFLFLKKASFDFPKVVVAGILGGLVGILINALFIDVFEASKVAFIFWILSGTIIGTINLTDKQLKTV